MAKLLEMGAVVALGATAVLASGLSGAIGRVVSALFRRGSLGELVRRRREVERLVSPAPGEPPGASPRASPRAPT